MVSFILNVFVVWSFAICLNNHVTASTFRTKAHNYNPTRKLLQSHTQIAIRTCCIAIFP